MATSNSNTSELEQSCDNQTQSGQLSGRCEEKKKRSRNPDQWLKTKRKQAILAGKSYVNTRGDLVLSKKIGTDCKCKNKCFTGVSEDSRKYIFNGFYNLKSYDEQNSYLYGLIRRHEIQRKRQPNSEKRTCSYKYYVRVKGKEILVCKKAFASIHSISDKKIRTLCLKHEQNIMFPRDNRGRHDNRQRKITPEVVTAIKEHIVRMLSGPSVQDYIKADKSQDINVTKLYKNFVLQREPQAIDPDTDRIFKNYDVSVKSWVYFKVFHEEFKSLDFNTVKRRLSDLRKALQVHAPLQSNKRKPGKICKVKNEVKSEYPLDNDTSCNTAVGGSSSALCLKQSQAITRPIVAPFVSSQSSVTFLPQTSNMSYNFVQPPSNDLAPSEHIGSQLQSCVYSISSQQQPLNLQIGAGNNACPIIANTNYLQQQQPLMLQQKKPLPRQYLPKQLSSSQAVPIVLPSNGQSYYFAFSNLPNVITVPPSSCATLINVSNKVSSVNSTADGALITPTLLSPHMSVRPAVTGAAKQVFQSAECSGTVASLNGTCNIFPTAIPVSSVDLSQRNLAVSSSKIQCTYPNNRCVDLSQTVLASVPQTTLNLPPCSVGPSNGQSTGALCQPTSSSQSIISYQLSPNTHSSVDIAQFAQLPVVPTASDSNGCIPPQPLLMFQ